MQVFYENKQWVNPIKNGKIDTEFFEKKIIEAQSYAKIKGVYVFPLPVTRKMKSFILARII